MGAYLSEPITEKISSDEIGERLSCGASSMQGWRVSQEVTKIQFLIIYNFNLKTNLLIVVQAPRCTIFASANLLKYSALPKLYKISLFTMISELDIVTTIKMFTQFILLICGEC